MINVETSWSPPVANEITTADIIYVQTVWASKPSSTFNAPHSVCNMSRELASPS